MKKVQEKVWMTVAKWAYQTQEIPMDSACKSMEERSDPAVVLQALGIF